MSLEVVCECPLGNQCERFGEVAGKQVIIRCRLYVKIVGQDPQSGEETEGWDCAWALMPMMQIETSNMVRGVQAATESMRNENTNAGALVHEGLARLARAIKPAPLLEIESEG